jgi:hypothetical protein
MPPFFFFLEQKKGKETQANMAHGTIKPTQTQEHGGALPGAVMLFPLLFLYMVGQMRPSRVSHFPTAQLSWLLARTSKITRK